MQLTRIERAFGGGSGLFLGVVTSAIVDSIRPYGNRRIQRLPECARRRRLRRSNTRYHGNWANDVAFHLAASISTSEILRRKLNGRPFIRIFKLSAPFRAMSRRQRDSDSQLIAQDNCTLRHKYSRFVVIHNIFVFFIIHNIDYSVCDHLICFFLFNIVAFNFCWISR